MKPTEEEFNKFVNNLQEEIYQEELRSFSKKVVEEFHNPKNWGKIPSANAYAIVTGPCGDTQMIFLELEDEIIKKASFMTDGCGPTVACGSKLTTMVTNTTIKKAMHLEPQDLEDALDGLPENHKHCALLAVNTLHEAIETMIKKPK